MNNIQYVIINLFYIYIFFYGIFPKISIHELYNFDKKITEISITKQTTRDLNIDGS